jgi:hypothetical protein
MGKCGWMDDPRWNPTTPRYCLLGPKSQKGHLALAQKPGTFHLVMGCAHPNDVFLFLGCKWGEWDSNPFHNRDPDIYATLGYVLIQSQRAYFYGCHIWHQQREVPPIHIDGV